MRSFGIGRSRNRTRSARPSPSPPLCFWGRFPRPLGPWVQTVWNQAPPLAFPDPGHATALLRMRHLACAAVLGSTDTVSWVTSGSWALEVVFLPCSPTLMPEGRRLGDETAVLERFKKQRGCHSFSCLWRGSKNIGSEVQFREELGHGHQLELWSR